ncbi:hypothetical protein [Nostoc sp.]
MVKDLHTRSSGWWTILKLPLTTPLNPSDGLVGRNLARFSPQGIQEG